MAVEAIKPMIQVTHRGMGWCIDCYGIHGQKTVKRLPYIIYPKNIMGICGLVAYVMNKSNPGCDWFGGLMDIFKLQGSLLSLPFEQTIRIHKARQPPATVEETSVRHAAADEGIQICLLVVTCRQGDLELLMFSYSKNNKVVNVSTKKHSHKEHITDLHIYIKHYQIKYSSILMYTYHILTVTTFPEQGLLRPNSSQADTPCDQTLIISILEDNSSLSGCMCVWIFSDWSATISSRKKSPTHEITHPHHSLKNLFNLLTII